jgi:hypothetical protein
MSGYVLTSTTLRPPWKCKREGEGIVIFAVAEVVASARNA